MLVSSASAVSSPQGLILKVALKQKCSQFKQIIEQYCNGIERNQWRARRGNAFYMPSPLCCISGVSWRWKISARRRNDVALGNGRPLIIMPLRPKEGKIIEADITRYSARDQKCIASSI